MQEKNYTIHEMPAQKNIALIAHDNMKPEMIDWCLQNRKSLEHHFLVGKIGRASCRERVSACV